MKSERKVIAMATYQFDQNDAGMEFFRRPAPPVPPHMRQKTLHIVFEDKDVAVFQEAFGDMDTAEAAMDILCGAPPEIQILAPQILRLVEKGES